LPLLAILNLCINFCESSHMIRQSLHRIFARMSLKVGRGMQKYYLYSIEEKFFHHYYHKTKLLYKFFIQFQLNPTDPITEKQFNYITKSIPISEIYQYLKNVSDLQLTFIEDRLLIQKDQAQIMIEYKEREWLIYSISVFEVEDLLFTYLRGIKPSFFVLNKQLTQYGWLSYAKKEILL
jgi:hypothetical protein